MMLRVENDRRFSLGHARITLAGVGAPSDGGFRILREGYAASNLGRRGWQVQEEKLTPVEIRQEGADTVLVIDVFDGELPPEPVMPREPDVAPAPPQVAAAQPAPARSPAPPLPREEVAVAAKQQVASRTPLLAGIGLLLLAVIGGAAWWFPPAPPPDPVTVGRPWLERSDGMNLRDLVQSASDAAAIHAAALRRQAAGRHDDALVLFEEAGERGHAPALTAVSRLYDPIGFVAGRPFRAPDPRAAARYYRDAVQKGDAAAEAPRAALKTWLEEQARAGNGTAETALREFWP